MTSPAASDGNSVLYALRIVRAFVIEASQRGLSEGWIRASVARMIERSFLEQHRPETRQRVRELAGRVLEESL